MTREFSPPPHVQDPKNDLLQVRNLSLTFAAQTAHQVKAVQAINFSIAAGESLALVGESGSGKSVTAMSLMQLIPPHQVEFGAGASITWRGEELIGANLSKLQDLRGASMGMVFQEPLSALNPLHRIGHQIGENLWRHQKNQSLSVRNHGRHRTMNEFKPRIIALLNEVGLDDAERRLDAYPHQLSGGQRQRVMIAMALANEPDLLILDEPTTALDATIQWQIIGLLDKIKRQRHMAMLLISHDLHLVARLADRICVMQHGKIVEQGMTDAILHHPSHDYTKQLLASVPQGHPAAIPPHAETLLTGQNIKVWHKLKKPIWQREQKYFKAVDGIDLSLKSGETLGIVGGSGSGKTTLGLACLRLIQAEGRILWLGDDTAQFPPAQLRRLRRDFQFVFQDPFGSLNPRLTVAQSVTEGLRQHFPKLTPPERDQKLIDLLIEVGLDPESRHRFPHEFSGGQRQRIAIARALILSPRLIVLDEPTSALDRSLQLHLLQLLQEIQIRRGLGYLFISHDLAVIRSMSHKCLILHQGKIIEQGNTEEIFAHPQHEITRSLIEAAGMTSGK
ncbi:MAG: dipeptide ABC transporter ATP-binding protein [Alphaproteobacteria bacterium]|nr:dipeptide ABC transporter ATP-binding protein [Alphaproteobacteria bacterium]